MTGHLERNDFNETFQSAYKKPQYKILTRLDKQNKTLLIAMLDMSTAFDTVEHVILLKRLNMTFEITSKAIAEV